MRFVIGDLPPFHREAARDDMYAAAVSEIRICYACSPTDITTLGLAGIGQCDIRIIYADDRAIRCGIRLISYEAMVVQVDREVPNFINMQDITRIDGAAKHDCYRIPFLKIP